MGGFVSFKGKTKQNKIWRGFSFPRRGLANYGFTACGSGHPGAFRQPAGPLGRRALRWKSLSHLPAGTRCWRSGRCSGHRVLQREQGPPCSAQTPWGGGGDLGKGKMPGETAGLTCPGTRCTSQRTGPGKETLPSWLGHLLQVSWRWWCAQGQGTGCVYVCVRARMLCW